MVRGEKWQNSFSFARYRTKEIRINKARVSVNLSMVGELRNDSIPFPLRSAV